MHTEEAVVSAIRDFIESAVFQPQNDYYYAGADLLGIAAAYAFHLAQAQAFLDGNKRTAISAASPSWKEMELRQLQTRQKFTTQ